MARIDPLKPEDMNDEQGQAYDEVVARGGRVGGPNGVYIRVPELFKLNQDLGNYLRDNHVNARLRQPFDGLGAVQQNHRSLVSAGLVRRFAR